MTNQFKYFEGKICSILTEPINRNFKEEVDAINKSQLYPQNVLDHFTGRVIGVYNDSVVLEHVLLKTRSLFRIDKIVGIIEEQEFNPDDPKDAEIIEKYRASQSPTSRGKVTCPQGHELMIPAEIEDGKQVECPICNTPFILMSEKLPPPPPPKKMPRNPSGAVDLSILKKLSEEAKKFN